MKILAARIMSSAMNGINANAYFKEVVSCLSDNLAHFQLYIIKIFSSLSITLLCEKYVFIYHVILISSLKQLQFLVNFDSIILIFGTEMEIVMCKDNRRAC